MSQTSDQSKESPFWKRVIDDLPGFTTAIGTTALFLSILYELGYFTIVGFELLTLMGPLDYLRNAILWLPAPLAFGALYIMAIRLLVLPFESSLNRMFVPKRAQNLQRFRETRIINILPWVFIPLALLITASSLGVAYSIVDLFGWGAVSAIALFLTIIFLAAILSFLLSKPDKLPITGVGVATVLGTLVFGTIFVVGASSAVIQMMGSANYRLAFSGEAASAPQDGVLLRSLEKGVLFLTLPDRTIQFYRWDTVANLSPLRDPLEELLPRILGQIPASH